MKLKAANFSEILRLENEACGARLRDNFINQDACYTAHVWSLGVRGDMRVRLHASYAESCFVFVLAGNSFLVRTGPQNGHHIKPVH